MGNCGPSSAYRRFREWLEAGVFRAFWRQGLLAYEALAGIDWEWLAMDGAMGKAPLGGEKTGPNPTDRAKKSLLTDGRGAPLGLSVAGANVPDFKLMRSTLQSMPVERPSPSAHAPRQGPPAPAYARHTKWVGTRPPEAVCPRGEYRQNA